MAWNGSHTFTVGEVLSAATLNTYLRDNVGYLHGDAGTTFVSSDWGSLGDVYAHFGGGNQVVKIGTCTTSGTGGMEITDSATLVSRHVNGVPQASLYMKSTNFVSLDNNVAINKGMGVAPSYNLEIVGNCNASGGFTSISDARLKTDVRTLADALDTILALRGVSYRPRRAHVGGGATLHDDRLPLRQTDRYFGVVAQEAQQVVPDLVVEAPLLDADGVETGETMLAFNYDGLVPVLVEALKELAARVEALEPGTRRRRAA